MIDPKEKRIGRRRNIPSLPMTWCSNPRRAPRCRDDKRVDGRIVEVSVTGAGIIATTLKKASVGDTVVIHCLDHICPVVIRRIELDLYPGESYYGVELLDGAGSLADELRRRFLDSAPGAALPDFLSR
ncbi:MAG: hypothetical protein KDB04_11610 [Acidimicrobiales bacterium]|nr:hypothetical protein [Acidimicrobiales bacterium]HRW37535.1 hypothetical protein [Aquihabitans sp.]